MNKHFESSPQIKQFPSKSIFLSEKRNTSILCGFCQTFGDQQNLKSQKQIKKKSKIGLKNFPKQDKNLLKSDKKKSLKALGGFNDSKNKVQSKQPIQNILQSKKIQQRSTNMSSQIVLYSNLFKKTQSSQKGNHLSQGPVNFSYEQKTLKKLPYSNSCINLKNQENKSIKSIQQNNQFKGFSHVPMTSSLNGQIMSANKNIKMSTNKINGNITAQNQKLEHLRFKSSISQNFSSLQISPVRQIPISEQSDRSEFVPSGKNNHDQTTINKILDLQSRQNLIKSDGQDVSSQRLKANKNKNNFQENMTQPFSQTKVISVVPQMQKDFSVKSGSNKDFLQISFDQNEQKLLKNLQSQTIKPEKIMTKDQEINYDLKNSNQILITVSPEKVLSSDVGTDLNQPQHTQIAQRHDVRIQKKIKTPSTNVFGRYSVQIPKSRNFNNMKVRRTISMKDQQDSSQEETSEVIYGFRNINNLVVMEDIAQDMQQSYMTRRQINFDSIEKSVLQQF